jgi:hypothetical protein
MSSSDLREARAVAASVEVDGGVATEATNIGMGRGDGSFGNSGTMTSAGPAPICERRDGERATRGGPTWPQRFERTSGKGDHAATMVLSCCSY